MDVIRETNIDFMKYRRAWVALSLLVLAAGVFLVFVHGQLNVGIDFKGGTQLTLRFDQRPDVDRLRQIVAATGVGESQIQRFGEDEQNEVMVRTPIIAGTEEGSGGAVLAALRQEYGDGFTVLGSENVGPQVGAELRRKGFLAVVWSMVGMLIYMAVRFELRFGVGATMATIHDVLVTLGCFAFLGFEFNVTTIAAFLTLVGYTVNDKIVVFDRVRENLRKNPGRPLVEVINRSINQTLSRTLLTGGTTILACAALMVWGGDVLRGFAFILTLGVIVGTYSSIYIASPFTMMWEQVTGGRRRGRAAAPSKPAAGETPKAAARPARGGRRAAR
jgi:preprotein translocase subunit SecF